MFVKLYWILPLFSALVWLAMLITMLTWWSWKGYPIYPTMDPGQTIAYISDVGAQYMYALFIAMATTTVVTLDAAMIAERWLRHNGRLAPNTTKFQKALDILAILCAIAGAIGIILLSIYNTRDYPNMHDRCLGVFLAGYVLSAIFICWEYALLGRKFRRHPVLAASFWLKLTFIVIEIIVAIAFGATQHVGKRNAAACLEWTLAFIFTFYVFTFVLDLLPAVKTKHHMSHPAVAEMGAYDGPNGYTNGYPNGQTMNSINGTNGNSAYGTSPGYPTRNGREVTYAAPSTNY